MNGPSGAARDEQKAPPGDWRVWLYLAGRGSGKTRSGAEWVRAQVAAGRRRIALVAHGGRITSDGGVMLLAQAERRFGIADQLARVIPDERDADRVVHLLPDILRARIFAIACGYEDADDL